MCVVFMVKSKQYSFKFVLKRFPRHSLDYLNMKGELMQRYRNLLISQNFYESFITLDTKIGFLVMEWMMVKIWIMLYLIFLTMTMAIRTSPPFKWYLHESMAFIAAELAVAIQILHDAKIVHRDIKPGNVIIDRNGHV